MSLIADVIDANGELRAPRGEIFPGWGDDLGEDCSVDRVANDLDVAVRKDNVNQSGMAGTEERRASLFGELGGVVDVVALATEIGMPPTWAVGFGRSIRGQVHTPFGKRRESGGAISSPFIADMR